MRGKLIIIEGIDGSGTSTQTKLLVNKLKKINVKAQLTKEPYQKQIINLIKLNKENITDLFLFLADRSIHYSKIKQWLKEGKWVISDRSFPSTLVYQWYSTNLKKILDENLILFLNHLSQFDIQPDLIFILNIKPSIAFKRLKKKNNQSQIKKYEKLQLMKRLSQGYLYFAKKYNWQIINVDAYKSIEDVSQEIYQQVLKLI